MKNASPRTWITLSACSTTTNLCFTATRQPFAPLVTQPFTTGASAITRIASKTSAVPPIYSFTTLNAALTLEKMAAGKAVNMNSNATMPTRWSKSSSIPCTTSWQIALKSLQQTNISVSNIRKGAVTHTLLKKKGFAPKSWSHLCRKWFRRRKT